MSKVVIRPAILADLVACAAIVNDWIDESNWLPRIMSHKKIATLFDQDLLQKRVVLVAEDNGQVAGYVAIDEAEQFVRALYLAPSVRNRGIGKGLLDEAKRICPKRLELGVFSDNVNAIRFYKREQFVDVPSGHMTAAQTSEGIAEHLMLWEGEGS